MKSLLVHFAPKTQLKVVALPKTPTLDISAPVRKGFTERLPIGKMGNRSSKV